MTLFDADGKWAENGTGKLAEAQVLTAAAAADYDPATERWTPAVPAEGAEITADGAVFTVTWSWRSPVTRYTTTTTALRIPLLL
ncbi:MAG: hypothetical protein ACLRZH_19215 [Ruthenibacterium lactatiformans]